MILIERRDDSWENEHDTHSGLEPIPFNMEFSALTFAITHIPRIKLYEYVNDALFNWVSKMIQDCVGFALLIRLVQKTRDTVSINQMQNLTQSWLGRPRFRRFARFFF